MGKLCRVVTPNMQEVIIQAATRAEMTQQLEKALQNSKVRTCPTTNATPPLLMVACGSRKAKRC
jgi:hypothetical protein